MKTTEVKGDDVFFDRRVSSHARVKRPLADEADAETPSHQTRRSSRGFRAAFFTSRADPTRHALPRGNVRLRASHATRSSPRRAARPGDMDWSPKSMMEETLRCLQKSETDLGVDLHHVAAQLRSAIVAFDKLHNRCERCRGRGVMKCVLCGGRGEITIPNVARCHRCLGCTQEQCTRCCGYGLT